MLARKILRDRANDPDPFSQLRTTIKGEGALHERTTLVFYHRDGAMVAFSGMRKHDVQSSRPMTTLNATLPSKRPGNGDDIA